MSKISVEQKSLGLALILALIFIQIKPLNSSYIGSIIVLVVAILLLIK
jgi:hypothetical protein